MVTGVENKLKVFYRKQFKDEIRSSSVTFDICIFNWDTRWQRSWRITSTSSEFLLTVNESWAVHDIVSFYAPVIQAVTNAKIEHEMNQNVQKFFGIDPLSNHFIVDPTHHVLHNFGFQDKYKKQRRVWWQRIKFNKCVKQVSSEKDVFN